MAPVKCQQQLTGGDTILDLVEFETPEELVNVVGGEEAQNLFGNLFNLGAPAP